MSIGEGTCSLFFVSLHFPAAGPLLTAQARPFAGHFGPSSTVYDAESPSVAPGVPLPFQPPAADRGALVMFTGPFSSDVVSVVDADDTGSVRL